jgi:acetyl-CoA/propionyl-CoA carboxylase biotin carboxyl carrier protein
MIEEVEEEEVEDEGLENLKAYFGDDTIYLEKLVERPRHVEVQILADTHGNVIHLGERDCSVQRRNQKLVEESPAPHLPEAVKQTLFDAAVAGAKAIGYTGAGTFEFVVQNSAEPYFMEVNTRLQVEHPITEMVTRIDLVHEQLRIAAGLPLRYNQSDVRFEGHAIECRITVEDATRNFTPVPGLITTYEEPAGYGVRVDSMPYPGYDIPKSYDSLLAKLITWAPTREEAIGRMRRALNEYCIDGVTTLLPFFKWVMEQEAFVSGHYDTGFIPTYFNPSRLSSPVISPTEAGEPLTRQEVIVEVNGKRFQVAMHLPQMASVSKTPTARAPKGPGSASKQTSNGNAISAPMSGTVVKVNATAGQTLEAGAVVCIIESMKMENDIVAPRSGMLKTVAVQAGEKVQAGALLIEFEA